MFEILSKRNLMIFLWVLFAAIVVADYAKAAPLPIKSPPAKITTTCGHMVTLTYHDASGQHTIVACATTITIKKNTATIILGYNTTGDAIFHNAFEKVI